MSRRRCHSPSSSSLSSRRASFLSRRSCLSISALMRCDSFSSADRQQQPAMVRAATDGATRFGAPRSSTRRVAEPTLDGHRGSERKDVGRLEFRCKRPGPPEFNPSRGWAPRGRRILSAEKAQIHPGSGLTQPTLAPGGEGELLLRALPTPGDARPLGTGGQTARKSRGVGARGRADAPNSGGGPGRLRDRVGGRQRAWLALAWRVPKTSAVTAV